MREPHGPEFQNGWQLGIPHELLGSCMIRADHHTRSRVPRGHEIVQQICRGGLYPELVKETDFRWIVLAQRRRIADIYRVPSGMFRTTQDRRLWPKIEAAATAVLDGYARRIGSVVRS